MTVPVFAGATLDAVDKVRRETRAARQHGLISPQDAADIHVQCVKLAGVLKRAVDRAGAPRMGIERASSGPVGDPESEDQTIVMRSER